MKGVIKNFIIDIYFSEKYLRENAEQFFQKNRGEGVNFYLGPIWRIFT
jgi:hypothetical protein